MKPGHFHTSSDRVKWRLCLGCGACAALCPDDSVALFDFESNGIHPVVERHTCEDCSICMDVCPLTFIDFRPIGAREEVSFEIGPEWGPVLEIWEGHAVDPDIRWKGASGGVLTALSAYAIEDMGMDGVLHTGMDPEDPLRNRTRISRSRTALMTAVGSRYSPASVCNGLKLLQKSNETWAFIGRPVEAAALRKALKIRPELERKIGAIFSFFCAEAPSTRGTVELLIKMGVNPEDLGEVKYRGDGWPGHFVPREKSSPKAAGRMTYRESWSFLQAYRPWSAQIWPDGTGELADISCGDPWYKEPDGKNPGISLVIVRTERGREILKGARDAGYLHLERAEPWKLEQSQKGLIQKKGAIWGRLMVMRLFGLPVPRYKNGHLFKCWWRLSLEEKLRSTIGTARRIISRKLYKPLELDIKGAVPVKPAYVAGESSEPKKESRKQRVENNE